VEVRPFLAGSDIGHTGAGEVRVGTDTAENSVVMTSAAVTFGRVARPDVVPRHLDPARKPSGWSRLGPRRIVGTCVHRMDGTLWGSETHFVSDDPHGRDALADFGIGGALDGALDGVIWEWLAEDDDRSPWASGPADGLEGDGVAFVRAHGREAINRDLRSIEVSGRFTTPVTPRQLDALCRLVAYVHDRAGVPWHQFPTHPRSGVVTQLQHWHFATKDCPGPVLRGLTATYQARARAIMRAAQMGQGQDSVSPLPPGLPAPTPSHGQSQSHGHDPMADGSPALAWLFGATTRTFLSGDTERWPGGEPRTYAYDPAGVISRAWLRRARREGHFPRIAGWRQVPGPTGTAAPAEVVAFANGWVLLRRSSLPPWVWADRPGETA